MNKIAIVFFCMLAHSNIQSQRIFFCDSSYVEGSKTIESNCSYFYNFTESRIDSLMMLLPKKDSFTLRPLKIVAPTNFERKIDGLVLGMINKDTIFKIEYKNGLADGFFIVFEEKDTFSLTSIRFGKKNGLQFYKYTDKATTYLRQMFTNGVPSGPVIETREGKIIYFCNFKNGLKHGAEYQFYESGELAWYRINERGKAKDGNYFRFNIEGDVVEEMIFKNGDLKKSIRYNDGKKEKVIKY